MNQNRIFSHIISSGDPTAFGNLNCPNVLVKAMQEVLASGVGNGYLPSTGSFLAKKAIAEYSTRNHQYLKPIVDDDVIICSGCSGAVELAISVLLDEGDNILVPRFDYLFIESCHSYSLSSKQTLQHL